MRLAAAINAINEATARSAYEKREVIAAKCRGLMRGYHARWRDQTYRTIASEHMVQSDLWNPETGRKSRSFTVAGVLDVEVWDSTSLKIIDHKTTSEDIEKADAPYWRQLVVEAQPTHYMLLKWLNGQKVDGAIWDVVKKPGIQPAQIRAKKEVADILATEHYYGQKLTAASLEALRNEPRETLEMYEARLAYDCTTERPGHYFQRRDVPRLDGEIHEWAKELWGHSQDMLYARRDNRWPKNPKACMAFKRPCAYLGICSGYDSPDSDKWARKSQVHAELPLTDGDGRDVLTNSRIGCFQQCRRKHFYAYELGITKVDDEEAEALYFGSLFHIAQDAWWSYGISKEENGNDNGASAFADATAVQQTL